MDEPTFKDLFAKIDRGKKEVHVGGICLRGGFPAKGEDIGIDGTWSSDASTWVKTDGAGRFTATFFKIPEPNTNPTVKFWAKNSKSENRPVIPVTE